MPRDSKALGIGSTVPHLPRDFVPHTTSAQVTELKQRLNALQARSRVIERERAEVAAAIEQAEAELEAAVAAPVAGGEDPTLWLPDELLLLILVHAAFAGGSRLFSSVCRRWQRLCQDRNVKEALWEARWELYAEGKREPRLFEYLETDGPTIVSLCAGVKGTMYCGTDHGSIEVRSDKDGSLLQTFIGHDEERPHWVTALAVSLDGKLFSGSEDTTIRVWSLHTGTCIRTLQGHTNTVTTLAVNEASMFSGSEDGTILVWECSSGNLVHTLTDLGRVYSLALGTHDQLYSGSEDGVIRVWSATDFTQIRTLTAGQLFGVWTLAVSKDGTLFSGSSDGIIHVWSGSDDVLLRTLEGHFSGITFLSFAPSGTLVSASDDFTIRVWREGGRRSMVLDLPFFSSWGPVHAFTRTGYLWVPDKQIAIF